MKGVEFHSIKGEAYKNDNIALINNSAGATLYLTRDLAAAMYRHDSYEFVQSLYVVGGELREHFNQM